MRLIFFLSLIFLFLGQNPLYAQDYRSVFFDVETADDVSLQVIYEELLTVADDPNMAAFPVAENFEDKVLQRFDNLFYVVSDIMDVHLRQARFKIVIFKTDDEVALQVEEIIAKRVESPSFYYRDENTIYISEQSFRAGILGHELGHAIISHYFVVPPPEKMQEVLCGYVEYTLLKHSNTN